LKVSAVTWNEFRAHENKALYPGFDIDDIPTVRRGDLLMSRANTAELLASPVLVDRDYPNLILSDKTLRLVPDQQRADSRFLLYALRHETARRYFASHATGTSGSMRNVSQVTINECPILLPPIEEQKRIAAILDKADAIRRKRLEAMCHLDDMYSALFHDLFGNPVRNERGWSRVRLDQIVECIDNGWSPVCLDKPVESGQWGVLKLGAVTYCRYRPAENKALPPGLTPPTELEVKKGDLLMTRKNTYELVAACAYVWDTPPQLLLSDLIFRFRLRQNAAVKPEYLWGLFTHPAKRRTLQTLAGGTAGSMPNISKGRLLAKEIEVPPLFLQLQYSRVVHHVNQRERKFQASLNGTKALFNCLVQRAFRGEL
jgi:type I restriction enzyme S subunit